MANVVTPSSFGTIPAAVCTTLRETLLFDAFGGRREYLLQSFVTMAAEQLHPCDDVFDAVCLVS